MRVLNFRIIIIIIKSSTHVVQRCASSTIDVRNRSVRRKHLHENIFVRHIEVIPQEQVCEDGHSERTLLRTFKHPRNAM